MSRCQQARGTDDWCNAPAQTSDNKLFQAAIIRDGTMTLSVMIKTKTVKILSQERLETQSVPPL